MKAELEPKEMQRRGVSLVSETEEEKQVLTDLWNNKGRPALWSKLQGGNVQLVIAPTPPDKDGK